MLMQFCLETSGRLDGDRYPVGKGRIDGADRRIILR
jgi:hypothetical protein